MACKSPTPPPLLPFAIPLLCLLLLFPLPSDGDYLCPISPSCGELKDIPYPFWIYNESFPSYSCGYPGFKLVCQNNTPILHLGSDDYKVSGIDNASRKISLADADVSLSMPPKCPRVRHNLTFLFDSRPTYGYENLAQYFNLLLEYASSDVNLTFFFNCTDWPPSLSSHEITCLRDGDGNKSYVFTDDTIPYELYDNCIGIVVAPVLLENMDRPGIVNTYGETLWSGFELNWSVVSRGNCGECERSKGRCGMNKTSDSAWVFACFCSNGIIEENKCGGTAGGGNNKNIIIGVVIGVAALLLLLCAAILFYRHKKKQRSLTPSANSFLSYFSSNKSSNDPEKCSSAHFQTHLFSYEELQEATDNFDASKELGDGGFGTVYKGKLRDGRIVAVKRLYENNYRRVEQFKNEIVILSRLRHQNLVDLYGCSSGQGKELLLVYEFIANGTVADHLHGSRASEGILNWSMRLNIAIETADALAYLHAVDPPIIHRDVKTCNILLDTSFHVKVADFGLSRLFPTDVTHISTAPQGTPGYLDPEYHQCYQLTDKSDVYSFGVVLVELISSKPAVDITRHRKEINLANMAMNRIQNGDLDQLVDEGLGYQTDQTTRKMITMVAEVAFRCLLADGDMRPPIKEVLEVLRAIQSEGCKVSKGGKDDTENGDDVGLLKNTAPFSPDTVMNKWASKSTTPNTSE